MAWSRAAIDAATRARQAKAKGKTKFAVTGPFPIAGGHGLTNISTKMFKGKTAAAATKRAVKYANLMLSRSRGR